jgi:hypothetical protein
MTILFGVESNATADSLGNDRKRSKCNGNSGRLLWFPILAMKTTAWLGWGTQIFVVPRKAEADPSLCSG